MRSSSRALALYVSAAALVCTAASAEVKTGAYRGNATAGRVIDVGFQPVVVIVKGNDTDVTDDLTSGVLRTATMAGDASKPLKGDQPLQANLVQSLGASGFTVGSDRKVNAAGIDYYWVAFSTDSDLATGSFVGNGTGQSVAGLGFSPDYVVVAGATARRALQRPVAAPDSYQFWAGSAHADAVTSLDADGFTVATSNFANEAGVTYHYAAWNAVEGETVVGAYVGSGTDDRSLTTPGLQPQYLVVRTATSTEDPFQRMRVHSGDASLDFRGTLQSNRIQSLESTGFQVGTDPRVNTAGGTYFYVAFGGCATCQAMSVSETATTIGVTTAKQYAATFDAASGGGITRLYDLKEDSSSTVDLAGGATGVVTLHDEGIQSGGVWYNLDNDAEANLHLLEATSARTVVRQVARHVDGGGSKLAGLLTSVDYGVYTAGRLAVDWSRWNQLSSAIPFTTDDRDLNVHLQAAAPLDGWASFSQSGSLGTRAGSDDFLLARIDRTAAAGPGARTDVLHVQYQDWGAADLTGASTFAADQWQNLYWSDTSGGSFAAGARAAWSAVTYVEPTDLAGPLDRKALDRASDYRAPAVPTVSVGGGWFHASEKTASPSDFFNEAEAAYDFTFDPLNGLDFTLDAGTTPRFSPFFKIRGWRSLSPTPSVTLIGTELAWRAAEQTGDVAPADDTSSGGETHRVVLSAPFVIRSGSEVRIKLRANSTQPLTVSGIHVAEVDPADQRDAVDATWTAVTFGGASSVTLPAGGTTWSDWVAFPVDESKSYSVTLYIDTVAVGTAEWFGPSTQKYILSGDQSAQVDWSGLGPGASTRIDALEELEVRESLSLTSGSDYRADLKPISRAHFAQDVAWYSTAQSSAAVTAPNVGGAGTVVGAVSAVSGRFGGGLAIDADGEYLTVPASSTLDPASGAFEVWFRPSYDFGTGSPSDDNAFFGYYIDNQNYFYLFHEPYAGGTGDNDGINFDVRAGNAVSNVTTGAGPSHPVWWRAGEWVHVRATWSSATSLLEIFVNGVLAASGTYAGAPVLPPDDLLYVGERNRFGVKDNSIGGTLDEITFYSSASAPTSLAHGGLASSSSEYLASGSRNVQLSFTGVDPLRRGEYLFLGADSQFSGLNVDLAVDGAGVTAGGLVWEYWSNASGWKSLEVPGFVDETLSLTRQGAVYWPDLSDWDPYSVGGGPELYTIRVHLGAGETYSTPPTEAVVKTDVLLFQYCETLTRVEQRFRVAVPPPTAVALVGFRAVAGNGRVALEWETASEIQNLGFHLYRATSEGGTYARITENLVPGLGSSPEGAFYRYVDDDVSNGVEVFYLLEDVEATGRRRRHGPVAATPSADAETAEAGASAPDFQALIAYGHPEGNRLTVSRRGPVGAVVELVVEGFYAEPLGDGTVRLVLPGLETGDEDASLAVARTWVAAVPGREAKLLRTAAGRIERLALQPAAPAVEEIVGLDDGTVRRGRRSGGELARSEGWTAADVLTVAFQGEEKKALVELRPFHLDPVTGQLLVARRLVATLSFLGRDASETPDDRAGERQGRPGRRGLVARLAASSAGLQAVSFEALRPLLRRRRSASALRLSRLGEAVPFHVEPDAGVFGPGSTLYFVAAEPRANPYDGERVYELELAADGVQMALSLAPVAGDPVTRYRYRLEREEHRLYQAALVRAEDPWLWDVLLSPTRKAFGFTVRDLDDAGEPARVEVALQGGSDFPVAVDHHVRVYVNGVPAGEAFWGGKLPERWEAELPAGVLKEGENLLELENAGDTGASYSMVFLDAYSVTYSRRTRATSGGLDGTFSSSGLATVDGLSPAAAIIEIAGGEPRWVRQRDASASGSLRFRVEAGRRYLAAGDEALGRPAVRPASATSLLDDRSVGADYLVIGPRAFLEAAAPLLEHRRRQGRHVATAATEDVYAELGHGESRPEAIRELIARAYRDWGEPRLRHVLLLGDGTYDFRDALGTGVANQVPPLIERTRFLWTASDPSYGAVHGADALPDVAVGRLPAADLTELGAMIEKILAYEDPAAPSSSSVVLVADDPDAAGDFEANALALESSAALAGRAVEHAFLRELGVSATRESIHDAFASGVGVMSYIGHGGIHLWASEDLLDIFAVDELEAAPSWPIVVSANCLNGYFHFPYFDALAERLVEAEGRGAIAAIAPSGLSWDVPAHRFHEALLREILSGGQATLGDALLAAQRDYTETGALPEVITLFHLLGDPGLELRRLR